MAVSRTGGHLPALLLPAVAAVCPALAQNPASAIDSLPAAVTRLDDRAGRLTIELPLTEVPAHGMVLTPVFRAPIPEELSLYGFTVEVVDGAGRPLPRNRLHHILLTDPSRRELFLPLALPIFGASKESPSPVLPRYLFGVPLPPNGRYLVAAMLLNPDAKPQAIVVRLQLSYIHPGLLFPLFRAYPWTMDVEFPLGGEGGRHDFDVPPGRTSWSWQGSPAAAGTIVAMGGHAHDFAVSIDFTDQTSGDTLWHQTPVRDAKGHLRAIPIGRFYHWYRLGKHIQPDHTYRVTVVYDNPTGHTISYGGMGAVAGLIVPDPGAPWPRLDPHDPIYRAQVRNLLNNMAGVAMAHDGPMYH